MKTGRKSAMDSAMGLAITRLADVAMARIPFEATRMFDWQFAILLGERCQEGDPQFDQICEFVVQTLACAATLALGSDETAIALSQEASS